MIPFEFLFFGATLLGVVIFSGSHAKVAYIGLVVVFLYKILFTDINMSEHFVHELPLLLNILGLLVGFEILSDHFHNTHLAQKAPKYLPDDWKGPFALLVMVFTLSIFLDNIASAVIGASLAKVVFRGKVTVGYLAAIIAASNSGGAGSVIGDTTTTMMWIDGVNWRDVTHAFLPAIVATIFFGYFLSKKQQAFQPIVKDEIPSHGYTKAHVDKISVFVVLLMLAGVVVGNIVWDFPALGLWAVILATVFIRKPKWKHVPGAVKNATFLLSLIFMASLMPVEKLPPASEQSVFALGFLSSMFDNIPLTKLALDQGGYDWGWLAYAVGYGGSMMWFGSSAGVAVSMENPQIRNTKKFLTEGWPVIAGYVVGYLALFLIGWEPHTPHK